MGEISDDREGVPEPEAILVDMAVEAWRFSRLFIRAVSKLDAGESGRYLNQLRYFLKRIEQNLSHAQLRIVDVERQLYDPGMAASALNVGDFEAEDRLIVDQMLEPIIMGPEGLRRSGVITLRKVEL